MLKLSDIKNKFLMITILAKAFCHFSFNYCAKQKKDRTCTFYNFTPHIFFLGAQYCTVQFILLQQNIDTRRLYKC